MDSKEHTTAAAAADDPVADKRRREQEQQRQRRTAQRNARLAARLCVACGSPLTETDTLGSFVNCAACRERARGKRAQRYALARPRRERERAKRAARAQARRKAAQNAPGAPVCSHCAGRDLNKDGIVRGRQRYVCRGCHRTSYGTPGTPGGKGEPPACPNPRCGGVCRKAGRDRRGRQKYYCPTCGRHNTRLWPTHVPSPGGPFPHLITLDLSLSAERALNAYVQKHTMSPVQAVRDILRKWADEPPIPLPRTLGVDAWGEPILAPRLAEPREDVNTRLINLSRSAAIKRRAAGNKHHLTVLMTWRLTVRLDDTAYQGLLRYMRRTGLEHQDAARALIIAAGREARGQNDWWAKPPRKREQRRHANTAWHPADESRQG